MTQEERAEKFNYYVGLTLNHLYANFPHGTNCNVSIFVKKEKYGIEQDYEREKDFCNQTLTWLMINGFIHCSNGLLEDVRLMHKGLEILKEVPSSIDDGKKEKWWQRLRSAIEEEAMSEVAKRASDMLTDALRLI
ncbi:hypothetical protein [uncultured Campylobacter sp.]|uniref:hypothetical protein n=1 Tax=uncultured Campylobacter sp. TaxID=218934 RepID=UPI0025E7AE95|nr:hypothetical protein [uncultured Campylobacter sp.]